MAEVLEWFLRGIVHVLVESLIRGAGWLIVRLFRLPEEIHADGCLVTVVGLLFWCAVVVILVLVLQF